jgi:hypothetical protein
VKKTLALLLFFLGVSACTKDEKPVPTALAPSAQGGAAASAAVAPTTAKVTDLGPGKQRIDGQNFTLDLASTGCKKGAECAVTIKLVAAADYHVNKQYPYRFNATLAPGLAFLGKSDPPTSFTKDAGDFVEDGEKSGTMTVRFKPSAAGEAKVAGTYKMSVCSADQCQIEAQPVALSVPVN